MENDDAYLNADASKINKDDDNMKISMEEEQKTVEYQETLKVDVKNIPEKKPIWRPIYEAIDAPFFEETDFSHKLFKTYDKII